jgi:uncharacterized membrane protein YfcA
MTSIVLPICIGIVAGLCGGLFGLISSVIIITSLTLFNLVPNQKTAVGTTIFILLPPLGILAFYHYWKRKQVNIKLGLLIMISYAIAAGAGGLISTKLSNKMIELLTAILLTLAAILYYVFYFFRSGSKSNISLRGKDI